MQTAVTAAGYEAGLVWSATAAALLNFASFRLQHSVSCGGFCFCLSLLPNENEVHIEQDISDKYYFGGITKWYMCRNDRFSSTCNNPIKNRSQSRKQRSLNMWFCQAVRISWWKPYANSFIYNRAAVSRVSNRKRYRLGFRFSVLRYRSASVAIRRNKNY